MYKAMKALAIAVLIVTIIGAGAVLYGINTLEPIVEQASVLATPAVQAQDVFDGVMAQVGKGTFTGRMFSQPGALDAEDCTFITYTVRLANKGFFPAEWVSLEMQPIEGDLLQLDNAQANVLPSRSRGDMNATLLHVGDASLKTRSYIINCYVFGRKITLEGTAQ